MAKLPVNEHNILNVSLKYDSEEIIEPIKRGYLGMSSIGHSCMRHLWYGFHFASPRILTRRVKRIFSRGDLEEARIITDFTNMGMRFFIRDKDNNEIPITGKVGEKQEEIVGFAGHAKGHVDGRCVGVPGAEKTEHLCEFKTANDKSFKLFVKNGCEKTSPGYYAQQQRYMHALKLTRSLFVVTNKNDESRYPERVYYDKRFSEELVAKEQHIILSETPPDKIGGPSWFECKYCSDRNVCHLGDAPQRNCRTCEHSDIENGGKWTCGYHEKELNIDEQIHGCDMWSKGWGL